MLALSSSRRNWMTIGRIINSVCVIQKRKDPLTRGAGTEAIAYMPVQLNSTQPFLEKLKIYIAENI